MEWDLRHIQCLIAISDAGSITDAAITLGVSQPQVSRTLRSLEKAWGVVLVSRNARETVLTAQGHRAAEQGRHLLAYAESMESAARGERLIRLGYVSSAAGRHTPALQRRWREAEPDMDLRLIHARGPLAGLSEGVADVAVLRRIPDPAKYSSTVVGSERLVAACADNDLWGRRRRLKLADFAGRPLVVNTQSDLDLDLWSSGFGPLRAFDVDSVDHWLDAITAGRGVGIATRATADQHRPLGLRYLPITDAPACAVRLCWPAEREISGVASLVRILQSLYV